MQTATETTRTPESAPATMTPSFAPTASLDLTLDDLAKKTHAELEALYLAAPLPKSLKCADGTPKGRMLAVRGLDKGPVFRALRSFSASAAFPWDGKSFSARSDREGTGVNRVTLKSVLGRQQLFPFRTLIAPSLVDGRDAIVLDYDLSDNPGYIRRIHDEVREVSPGLLLGPAMLKTSSGARTVLWFALSNR